MRTIFLYLSLFCFFACKQSEKEPKLDNNTLETVTKKEFVDAENFFNPKKNKKVIVSAHRGGKNIKNYPENCLETIDYLYANGVQVFEIDVNQIKDGTIILLHDNSFAKTTNSNKTLKEVNEYNELNNIKLKDSFGNQTKFKIPKLESILEWGKGKNVYFMIDFKQSVSYESVIDLIRKNEMEKQCVLIAYTESQAKKLHKLGKELMLSVPMRNLNEFNMMMNSDIPTKNMVAFTGTRLSEKELYKKIADENIMSILGTIGNLDNRAKARGNRIYKEYKELGVNIFATDRPLEVKQTFE